MKKFLFLLTFLALGLITSCQKDDYLLEVAQPETNPVVKATIETAVRTQLDVIDGAYKTIWSADDAISFIYRNKHYKYDLAEGGEGNVTADFEYNPFFGTVCGSIESTIDSKLFIGVYPFSTETKVAQSGNDITVKTAIPAQQVYSPNSFGHNASPMVAVTPYVPDFSFKNLASCLALPLKGEGKILYATLESKTQNIAGTAVATVVVDDNNTVSLPTTAVTEEGVKKIMLACGEDGIELNADKATDFFFVLAPGTYEANDLVITFYDEFGNYFKTEITATNTLERSKVQKLKNARTFEVQGTEEIDIWVKAQASAYMEAERILPSLSNTDVEAWVNNLKNKANTKAVIEEAITYLTLKKYKAAYEVLDGVPGFAKDTKLFEATGVYTMKVDYEVKSYMDSMLNDIDDIEDINSLIAFLEKFESDFAVTDFSTNFLNSTTINGYIDQYINAFAEALAKPEAESKTYRETIKEELENSITGIDSFVKGLSLFFSLTDASKTAMNTYEEQVLAILNNFDNMTDQEIKTAVNALPSITLEAVGKLSGKKYTYTVNPIDFIKKANEAVDSITNSATDTVLPAIAAGIKSVIEDTLGENTSLADALKKATEVDEEGNPTYTAQFLTALFEQESVIEGIKTSLRTAVEAAENQSNSNIDKENISEQQKAINATAADALRQARKVASGKIVENFNATNKANLNNGAWSIFQKILKSEQCINAFDNLGIMDVYNALVDLSNLVEEMIAYDKGNTYYHKQESEYQEDVDWWVIRALPELE